MSKRRPKNKPSHGHDRHHILWPRTRFNKGFNQLLRRYFVYELPMNVHQQLHATVRPVPVLDEEDARRMWEELKEIDHDMELMEALVWLRNHAPDSEFAIAMIEQQGFLQNNL